MKGVFSLSQDYPQEVFFKTLAAETDILKDW